MSSGWESMERDRALFPLTTVGSVRQLFECHLKRDDGQPNLALLSIVAGFVENTLTSQTGQPPSSSSSSSPPKEDGEDVTNVNLPLDPALEFGVVEALMAKFESTVRGFCEASILGAVRSPDPDPGRRLLDERALIKHVADIVWNTLSKSQYKDRPHLQSVYSYLTGNKLDCFGVAYAVVAACQLLEMQDVHLALSEDHAWVVFGPDGTETAEVTWHGKGNEDKRGQAVEPAKAKSSWLYVAGRPVICDRYVEVAAMVSAINPAISSTTDSIEVGAIQQELLWLLYDNHHLQKFPMAIGNLGDLEEISPSLGRPLCRKLYEEAIEVNRKMYANHHVYPYSYEGGHYYRQGDHKRALESWSNAADVMRLYNYSKDDEEIYKEFMEIANDLIPHILKRQHQQLSADPSDEGSVLRDAECYKNLLKFYDGLCCWEEGSATPIMHVGWSKPMVNSVSKFSPEVRCKVAEKAEVDDEEGNFDSKSGFKSLLSSSCGGGGGGARLYPSNSNSPSSSVNSLASPSSSSAVCNVSPGAFSSSGCLDDHGECFQKLDVEDRVPEVASAASANPPSSEVKTTSDCCDIPPAPDQVIADLSDFCGRRLLNVDYLLGSSCQPFERKRSPLEFYSKKPLGKRQASSEPRAATDGSRRKLFVDTSSSSSSPIYVDFVLSERAKKEPLVLHSAKMRGMQGLFGAEKLNASAIQLQLTAQSQTDLKKPSDESRPKRFRRE